MLIQVMMNSGEDAFYYVQTDDELQARFLAYCRVYCDPDDREFSPDEDTVREYTSVVVPKMLYLDKQSGKKGHGGGKIGSAGLRMSHRFKKGDFFRIVTWPKGDDRATKEEKEWARKRGEELKGRLLTVESTRLYRGIQILSFHHPDEEGQEFYQICADFVEWVPKGAKTD